GPDVIAVAIALYPDRNGIAAVIDGDLGIGRISRIIGLDQLRAVPARAHYVSVGPDVIAGTIVLIPDRNGIAAVIDGDLGFVRNSHIIGLDQLRATPARARYVSVGPDVTIVLNPNRNGIAAAIDGDLGILRISRIGLDQLRATPARAHYVSVGPDVITSANRLVPEHNSIASSPDHDQRTPHTSRIPP
ncbi:MAG: hypothetical protein GY942_09280, partial [Aestuariibacter sp.]|nr:hypothetical protein [Aestuariibacter sp.]